MMVKKKRIKKVIQNILGFLLILLFPVSAMGVTYAYYFASGNLRNALATKGSGIYTQEIFNKNDRWLPAETKEKKVHFGNQGEIPQLIRFRVEVDEYWIDGHGNSFIPPDSDPVEINWAVFLGNEWTYLPDSTGNWYYYDSVLFPDGETNLVVESVRFSDRLSNDEDHAKDYTDSVCKIVIYLESLNVDENDTRALWGKEFSGDPVLIWTTI